MEGAAVGFRAVIVGLAALGVVVVLGTYLLWHGQTEQHFLFWSTFPGGVLALLSPLFAFAGALGGALGTSLRRFVLPQTFNPPAH